MKNFKKLIAMGISFAAATIMSVSVLATGTGTAADPYTEAYDSENNAIIVSAIKDKLAEANMVTDSQYTVVVLPAEEKDSYSYDNIYYINQADGADTLWADGTTWGTPETLTEGDYVVRVGDEAGNVYETYFTIALEPTGPVVTFMNGTTTVATVDTVDGKAELPATNPELAAVEGYATTSYTFVEWVTVATVDGAEVTTPFTADTVVEADTAVYPKFKSNFTTGDIDGKNGVKSADKSKIHYYLKSTGTKNADVVGIPISHLLGDSVITGDIDGKNGVKAADKSKIHYYLKSSGTKNADVVNLDIFVVNK